jgi:cysteine synthase
VNIVNPARTVLDAIGNTPLVEIRNLNPFPEIRIFAKLEGCNPGGSIKDRIALSSLAEKSGQPPKDHRGTDREVTG